MKENLEGSVLEDECTENTSCNLLVDACFVVLADDVNATILRTTQMKNEMEHQKGPTIILSFLSSKVQTRSLWDRVLRRTPKSALQALDRVVWLGLGE